MKTTKLSKKIFPSSIIFPPIFIVSLYVIYIVVVSIINIRIVSIGNEIIDYGKRNNIVIERSNLSKNFFSLGYSETITVSVPELDHKINFYHIVKSSIGFFELYDTHGSLVLNDYSSKEFSYNGTAVLSWLIDKNENVSISSRVNKLQANYKGNIFYIDNAEIKKGKKDKDIYVDFLSVSLENKSSSYSFSEIKGYLSPDFISEITINNEGHLNKENNLLFKDFKFKDNFNDHFIFANSINLISSLNHNNKESKSSFMVSLSANGIENDYEEINSFYSDQESLTDFKYEVSISDVDKNSFLNLISSINASFKERSNYLSLVLDQGLRIESHLFLNDFIDVKSKSFLKPQKNGLSKKIFSFSKSIGHGSDKYKYLRLFSSETNIQLSQDSLSSVFPRLNVFLSNAIDDGYLLKSEDGYYSDIISNGPVIRVNGKVFK